MSYPKWLYHAEKEPIVVKDQKEHEALGAGWVESPADIQKAAELEQPESEEKPQVEEKQVRGRRAGRH